MNKLNKEQRREFVQLLWRLLINTYAARIEAYKGEPMQYLNERVQDDDAEVRTKLFMTKGEILLDYRLVNVAGR
jgi:ABC-type transporter MlaC component